MSYLEFEFPSKHHGQDDNSLSTDYYDNYGYLAYIWAQQRVLIVLTIKGRGGGEGE